tara:strand:+ start:6781 stop:6960 length:180 start_codon:yes stop_codon:yes gene_type:complete
MTIVTNYEQETFKSQVRLLNILLDTNKKLERIATSLEKANENKEDEQEILENFNYGGTA